MYNARVSLKQPLLSSLILFLGMLVSRLLELVKKLWQRTKFANFELKIIFVCNMYVVISMHKKLGIIENILLKLKVKILSEKSTFS